MTDSSPEPSGSISAPPLELRGTELLIQDADPLASRVHRLTIGQAHVLAAFMRRPNETVALADLLGACPGDPPNAERMTGWVRRLRKVLPDGNGVRIGIVADQGDYRLVIDERQSRLVAGRMELHPAAAWWWLDGRSILLRPALVSILELLMRADQAIVTDDKLCRSQGITTNALRQRISLLKRDLTAASGASIDLVREAGGYRLVIDERTERITVESLELNPAAGWCWLNGRRVDLQLREVRVLAALMDARGAAIARADLCRAGGARPLEGAQLNSLVCDLRKRLTGVVFELIRGEEGIALHVGPIKTGRLTVSRTTQRAWVDDARLALDAALVEFLAVLMTHGARAPLRIDALIRFGLGHRAAVEQQLEELDDVLRVTSAADVRIVRRSADRCQLSAGKPQVTRPA